MSYQEYDLSRLQSRATRFVGALVGALFAHFYLGYYAVLLVQTGML